MFVEHSQVLRCPQVQEGGEWEGHQGPAATWERSRSFARRGRREGLQESGYGPEHLSQQLTVSAQGPHSLR